MMDAALDFLNGDFLNGPGGGGLDSAGLAGADLGGVLASLGMLSGKLAAARAAVLSRFDAARGHDADGYGSSASWLAAKGRTTRQAAGAEVRRMRQFRAHPVIAAAVARGGLSDALGSQDRRLDPQAPARLARRDRQAPGRHRRRRGGAGGPGDRRPGRLGEMAAAARPRPRRPRRSDYDDRYLKLATTIDGVGRVNGNLTGECAAAVQAVLEALGKKASPDDDRSEPQRYHDALQEACELLLAARLVPGRAGTPTRADVIIALSQLRSLPGAPEVEHAYLAGTSRRARPPVRPRRPGRRLRRHHQPRRHRPPRPVGGGQDDRHRAGLPRHHRQRHRRSDARTAPGTAAPGTAAPGTRHRPRHGDPAGHGTGGQDPRAVGAAPPPGPRHCPRKPGRHCGTPSPGSPSTSPPAPPASPPSCAGACSTSPSTASPSSSTSAPPPPSRRTSAAPYNCAPRAAANGPAAPSAPSTATSTTCATSSTAARHP